MSAYHLVWYSHLAVERAHVGALRGSFAAPPLVAGMGVPSTVWLGVHDCRPVAWLGQFT